MGNYWSVHLPHLLEPNGTLAPLTGRGLRLAQYWTQIVAQASNYDERATLRCRRRPRFDDLSARIGMRGLRRRINSVLSYREGCRDYAS